MAITIRNKRTEDMIHRIGKRNAEGPSRTIQRLAEKELANGFASPAEPLEESERLWAELMALAPPRDPNLNWEDIEQEMQSLFDYMEEGPVEKAQR